MNTFVTTFRYTFVYEKLTLFIKYQENLYNRDLLSSGKPPTGESPGDNKVGRPRGETTTIGVEWSPVRI